MIRRRPRVAILAERRVRRIACAMLLLTAAWGACAMPSAVGQNPAFAVRRQTQFSYVPANIYVRGPRGAIEIGYMPEGLVLPVGPNGPTYSGESGLRLYVKSDWPGQYGYQPLQITVESPKPATSDVVVEFRFNGGTWGSSRNGVTARKQFVLPQGKTKASMDLLVPQYNSWNLCRWETYVDGALDEDLTVTQIDIGTLRSFNQGNNVNDVSALGVMLSDSQHRAASTNLGLAYSVGAAMVHRSDPENLPTDWIAYTSLNVVLMPADRVDQFFADYPQQAKALLDWVATGGNLWLVGAGRQWQHLPEVEQLLAQREGIDGGSANEVDERVASDASRDSPDDNRPLPPRWRFAPLDIRATEPAEGAIVLAGYPVDDEAMAKAEEERLRRRRERMAERGETLPDVGSGDPSAMLGQAIGMMRGTLNQAKTSAEWFAVRGWGLGAVVGFKRDLHGSNDLANQEATRVLSQSLISQRQQWGERFGSVPDDSNAEFNDWLIPGVGMAPVGSFQVLITLFVLAIGPFTYWILRRTGKLPMLIAIVPAAAIATTLALFAYGVLADGVSARVRGRSVTLLNQTTGQCTSWGRYSYYAGIAPRTGMEIPVDQAMFPILPAWGGVFGFGGRNSQAEREVVWDDRQRLTRGWLPSRTPTQYHAIVSRPSTKQLEFRQTGQGLRIANRLGIELAGAAIQDHEGKFYWCAALPADKAAVLVSVDQSKAASEVRRLFTEHLPELPSGDDGRRRRSGGYYNYSLSESLLEGRLGAINAPQLEGWGKGRYIAFTTSAIELDPGVAGIEEQNSFHVIEGSWQP
jgi:hypothetical protein